MLGRAAARSTWKSRRVQPDWHVTCFELTAGLSSRVFDSLCSTRRLPGIETAALALRGLGGWQDGAGRERAHRVVCRSPFRLERGRHGRARELAVGAAEPRPRRRSAARYVLLGACRGRHRDRFSELPGLLSYAEGIARSTAKALDAPTSVTLEEERALEEIARELHIDHGESWAKLLSELN